ncbi:MAG: type III pantothenate kinase [Ruminococcus sp.]|jgi:type III pantothenate kinase|nr:type III pantothenate kinase [Ruminococcus sp.]
MFLAINSGNEFTDIGVYDADKLKFRAQFVTPPAVTADEYTVKLRSMLGTHDAYTHEAYTHDAYIANVSAGFDGAVIANVADIGSSVISAAAKRLTSGRVIVIGPGVKTGLNIRIDNPAALGANLVAIAAGATSKYGYPAITADFAAATAFTVIDRDAIVRGGALIPGFALSLRALSDNAAELPRIHVSESASYSVLGTNTESCMKSGIVYAAAAVIDGFVKRYKAILGTDAAVVITGRYAKIASKYSEERVIIDDTLVLDGLAAIYMRNVT